MEIILVLLGLLVVIAFFLHWFRFDWYWKKDGCGAPNKHELVPASYYHLVTTFSTGAKLYELAGNTPETSARLLFLLGAQASVHHRTQYLISKAFEEAGFHVYLLEYASICNPDKASPDGWSCDIQAAYDYLEGVPYVIARSLSCHLVLRLIMNGCIEPPFIGFITPVVEVENFVLSCCTRKCFSNCCVAHLPRSCRCAIFYYEVDFLTQPKCCNPLNNNVAYFALPTCFQDANLFNVHCQGPLLQRNMIANHFKSFVGL